MTPETPRDPDVDLTLPRRLMEDFAERTGLTGEAPPRRYLWTDAFAVCNFLGLHRHGGEGRWRQMALELVEQVHHVLGRHRDDDSRRGWLSGLDEEEGERHPTRGGLRIGKDLPEREAGEAFDPRLEWDRDGQYFHYLTKWMHALERVHRETGRGRFHRWARELAATAHDAFTYRSEPAGELRMVWKMSIALDRPLVPSMGHHDPLDAWLTYLDLETAPPAGGEPPSSGEAGEASAGPSLETEIREARAMCEGRGWATEDPLGIGGLLTDVARLTRLVVCRGVDEEAFLLRLAGEAARSLGAFARIRHLSLPAGQRLAFRELGLSIGLRAVEASLPELEERRDLRGPLEDLVRHRSLADEIEAFWTEPENQASHTWTGHLDINAVMLATSLAPGGYLGHCRPLRPGQVP